MCKNTCCTYALTCTGELVDWCSFYRKGRNLLPTGCQIPILLIDIDGDATIDLVDEVK